ncbi:unnamed protein product, partial [Mesorhabditis belari]|uniref:Uncharacterized protein n=1 Tax=Mesorhabditis belari TaxID=2138241 RepID=A0AAF3FEF3_9BILA
MIFDAQHLATFTMCFILMVAMQGTFCAFAYFMYGSYRKHLKKTFIKLLFRKKKSSIVAIRGPLFTY